jgi:hypothetical protein
MSKLTPLFALSGLFFLASCATVGNHSVKAAAARPLAVRPLAVAPPPAQVNCGKHGGLVYKLANGAGEICIDAAFFAPSGVACAAPPVGSAPTVYAKLQDGSCVPLIGVPPPGSIAGLVTSQFSKAGLPGEPVSIFYQFFMVGETPVPGSNLCPNPDGTAFVVCSVVPTVP